jgi:uncharacterized lipoprotein YmbA
MKHHRLSVCALVLLCGCASRQRDHFYILDASPPSPAASRSQFSSQVTLQVTVPSLVDRGEMVLTTSGGVSVLDHERWAAPLADLVTATLGQDIERRRSDVVVLPKSADHAGMPLVRMRIEIDRITARFGEPVAIETHWRVGRMGQEIVGRDTFVSPQQPQNYTEVASALSACIALLADRLATEIPQGAAK